MCAGQSSRGPVGPAEPIQRYLLIHWHEEGTECAPEGQRTWPRSRRSGAVGRWGLGMLCMNVRGRFAIRTDLFPCRGQHVDKEAAAGDTDPPRRASSRHFQWQSTSSKPTFGRCRAPGPPLDWRWRIDSRRRRAWSVKSRPPRPWRLGGPRGPGQGDGRRRSRCRVPDRQARGGVRAAPLLDPVWKGVGPGQIPERMVYRCPLDGVGVHLLMLSDLHAAAKRNFGTADQFGVSP